MNEDGTFFTGLSDGRIVRVNLDGPQYTTIAYTGSYSSECGSLHMESICGRPLGIRPDPTNKDALIVTDAYMGLLRVNVLNGNVETLVRPQDYGLTLMNDLDIDHNIIYFSNTGRFPRNQIHKMLIEAQPTGSILAYDMKTGVVKVIASDLIMPNGVTLTHDKSALLVTVMYGIVRIELPVNRESITNWDDKILPLQVKLVQNDLQGSPDNIRRNHRNTYFVALGSKRSKPFSLPQFLGPFLTLRKLTTLFGLETMTKLIPLSCLMVEVNDQGEVLNTFQDETTTCYWVSEVEQIGKNVLLLGSWRTPFLARTTIQ